MKHVILHLLRKLSFPITLLVILGLPLNFLILKNPRLVFPSCLMTPLLLLFWEIPAFRRLARERAFWMLPLARARTARSFWMISVLIVPGLAALLALPFFCGDTIVAFRLGQSNLQSVLRFCYSVVWGSSLSGALLLAVALYPNPRWWRFRAIRLFWMLYRSMWFLVLCWILVTYFIGPTASGMKAVIFFLATVSFRISDLGKVLVGLAVVIVSQVVLRNNLIQYGGPADAETACATTNKAPHPGAAIVFQKQNHPLLSLCLRIPFLILTMGIAVGAFLCIACILAHVISFKSGLQLAVKARSDIAEAFPAIIAMGVIYLPGYYLDKLSLFRAIRVLPVSSQRFAACVATTLIAGTTAMYAAGLVATLIAGKEGAFLNAIHHTLLVLCCFQLLAVAVVLTCNRRLLTIVLLLMIIVTLLLIGFMIAASDFAFALFAPVGSLSSSALFTNTFGLVLILVAFFWIHHSISHSTGLYQLKSDEKSEGKGSL